MHTKFIPIQDSRRDTFGGMANAKFYREFVSTGKLRTVLIGERRYTTPEWEGECVTAIAEQAGDVELLPRGRSRSAA